MDKRIGAQYYTIRDFCRTLEDFDASCKKVKEIGYKTVQLSGIGDFEGEDVKKILDKYDLIAVCTHRPPQNYLENIEKEIEFHKAIGCNVAGLGAMPQFSASYEAIKEFGEQFTQVSEKLKEHGITFAYHNHSFEFEKIDGKYAFDAIIKSVKSDNFKLILDVYWLAYAGVNPAKFIREYSDKIACIHFKDLKIKENKPCYAEIGQGNLDWDEIISACNESEAEFALVEQDTCDGDPFESLKISYDFLKEKGFN